MESEAIPAPLGRPKPKRRWFQYSISTLLLLMVVCAAVLALFVNPAARQRRAVKSVIGLGGQVAYASPDSEWAIRAPEWLRQSLGVDYFQSVEAVYLNDTQVSDAALANLTQFPDLKLLSLRDTPVSDAGLVHLKMLTTLRVLCLAGTDVSDAGLVHLQPLTGLRELSLEDTRVSDQGIQHLKGMTKLRKLVVFDTQVTEYGQWDLHQDVPECKVLY